MVHTIENKHICYNCGAKLNHEGDSLHCVSLEYDCGLILAQAIDDVSDEYEITRECGDTFNVLDFIKTRCYASNDNNLGVLKKQKLSTTNDFIQAIEQMIRKEEEHLIWLKQQEKSDVIDKFISESEFMLNHYHERYSQYKGDVND